MKQGFKQLTELNKNDSFVYCCFSRIGIGILYPLLHLEDVKEENSELASSSSNSQDVRISSKHTVHSPEGIIACLPRVGVSSKRFSVLFLFRMSSKGNRRAKGDKGPAKSSQSIAFMNSLSPMEGVDMSLLNGIDITVGTNSTASRSNSECAVYFGRNELYRSQLQLLSKKSAVTRLRVGAGLKGHC